MRTLIATYYYYYVGGVADALSTINRAVIDGAFSSAFTVIYPFVYSHARKYRAKRTSSNMTAKILPDYRILWKQ